MNNSILLPKVLRSTGKFSVRVYNLAKYVLSLLCLHVKGSNLWYKEPLFGHSLILCVSNRMAVFFMPFIPVAGKLNIGNEPMKLGKMRVMEYNGKPSTDSRLSTGNAHLQRRPLMLAEKLSSCLPTLNVDSDSFIVHPAQGECGNKALVTLKTNLIYN